METDASKAYKLSSWFKQDQTPSWGPRHSWELACSADLTNRKTINDSICEEVSGNVLLINQRDYLKIKKCSKELIANRMNYILSKKYKENVQTFRPKTILWKVAIRITKALSSKQNTVCVFQSSCMPAVKYPIPVLYLLRQFNFLLCVFCTYVHERKCLNFSQ